MWIAKISDERQHKYDDNQCAKCSGKFSAGGGGDDADDADVDGDDDGDNVGGFEGGGGLWSKQRC